MVPTGFKVADQDGSPHEPRRKVARSARKWSGKFHIFQLLAVILSTIIAVNIVRLERQEIL